MSFFALLTASEQYGQNYDTTHADAPAAKKKVSLGKGTTLLYRAVMRSGAEGEEKAPRQSVEGLLSARNVGGLVDDLRFPSSSGSHSASTMLEAQMIVNSLS